MSARATEHAPRQGENSSGATTTPSRGRGSARSINRRDQVLQAAKRLFARRGYDAVGLREIAQEVGIRAPSLFKHFPSKQAIYNLVLGELFDALASTVREAIDGPGDHAERLERLVNAYIDFILEHPQFPAILFRELLDHPQAVEQRTTLIGLQIYHDLERFIRSGRRVGAFREVSAPHMILGFTGMVTFYHAWQPALTDIGSLTAGREVRRWKEEVVTTMRLSLLREDRRGKGGASPVRRRSPRR